MSNLISGLFLIAEQPFKIGDSIAIDTITGEVLSIDALSIKVRTPENTMVRIPNETLIKSNITNLSRFEMRRLDLNLSIDYKADVEKIRHVLLKAIEDQPLCLKEPAPVVAIVGFSDGGVNWQLSVYVNQENFGRLRLTLLEQLKHAIDTHGIELAYPMRTLYLGTQNSPLQVQVIPENQP